MPPCGKGIYIRWQHLVFFYLCTCFSCIKKIAQSCICWAVGPALQSNSSNCLVLILQRQLGNLEQFTKHCNRNSLLSEYQSAYRKNHTCETSLIKLVNDILWGMEEQLVTAVVILDLSSAFHTVDHDLLLEVLEKWFGITGSARLWYQNYLNPRKFKVAVGQKNDKLDSQTSVYHREVYKGHSYSLPMHPP